MTNYVTTDIEITSIADAIRAKTSTTAALTVPTGFINAINSITGGGVEEISTAAEMDAKLVSENIGKLYKYIGTTTTKYINGRLYRCYEATAYAISTTVTNGTYSGASSIAAGGTATVTISANSGYAVPTSVNVSGATYSYNSSTGVITLSNPTGNVTISATCIVNNVDYLCITANEANCTVSMTLNGTISSMPVIYYSTNKSNWSLFTIGSTSVTLSSAGSKVYFKGNNSSFSTGADSNYIKFNFTGSVAASGNVMTLLDDTGASLTIPTNYCFSRLFYNCQTLTSSPKLPATTLTDGCYYQMFYYDTTLVVAPKLPALYVPSYGYYQLLGYCSSLVIEATEYTGYYEYRIPTTGTGSYADANSLRQMFYGVDGSVVSTPSMNTIYYCERQPV